MRKLFNISTLTVAILALSLGAIACGDDNGDDNGGTGGTGGSSSAATCADACGHFYADCGRNFEKQGVPLTQEDCETLCGQRFNDRFTTCLADSVCAKQDDCFSTPECTAMCTHLYDPGCDVPLPGQDEEGNPVELTEEDCNRICAQGKSLTDSMVTCLTGAECTEDAVGACLTGG